MSKQICEFRMIGKILPLKNVVIWGWRICSSVHLCLLFLTDLAKILGKSDRIGVWLLIMKYAFLELGWKLGRIDMLVSGFHNGRSVFTHLWESSIQFSIEWKQKIEKKKTVFFSSEGNILNFCCPWISNARASGTSTTGLVPEIPLIHRYFTPNSARYLSLHDTIIQFPNKSCLVFLKSNSVSFWFWEYEELIHLKNT